MVQTRILGQVYNCLKAFKGVLLWQHAPLARLYSSCYSEDCSAGCDDEGTVRGLGVGGGRNGDNAGIGSEQSSGGIIGVIGSGNQDCAV